MRFLSLNKMSCFFKAIFLLSFLFFSVDGFASSEGIAGYWVTKSDKNGEKASVVKIWQDGKDEYEGKVVKLFQHKDTVYSCDRCPAPFSHKPVLGLTILNSLKYEKPGSYTSGRILDPRSGHVYKLNVTLISPEKLKVRGYLGMPLFGRTQYWARYHGAKKPLLSV